MMMHIHGQGPYGQETVVVVVEALTFSGYGPTTTCITVIRGKTLHCFLNHLSLNTWAEHTFRHTYCPSKIRVKHHLHNCDSRETLDCFLNHDFLHLCHSHSTHRQNILSGIHTAHQKPESNPIKRLGLNQLTFETRRAPTRKPTTWIELPGLGLDSF